MYYNNRNTVFAFAHALAVQKPESIQHFLLEK